MWRSLIKKVRTSPHHFGVTPLDRVRMSLIVETIARNFWTDPRQLVAAGHLAAAANMQAESRLPRSAAAKIASADRSSRAGTASALPGIQRLNRDWRSGRQEGAIMLARRVIPTCVWVNIAFVVIVAGARLCIFTTSPERIVATVARRARL